MTKAFLVAKREFLATVLTKAFLFGILLPPVVMGFAFVVMPLLMTNAAPKTAGVIAVIDQSPDQFVGKTLQRTITAESFKSRHAKKADQRAGALRDKGIDLPADNRTAAVAAAMAPSIGSIRVDILPPESSVDAAKKPIESANVRDQGDAASSQRIMLVVIPAAAVLKPPQLPDASRPGEDFARYQFFVAPKLDVEVQDDIKDEVDRAVVDARLTAASLNPREVRTLTAAPHAETKVVTPEGERADSGAAVMLVPIGFLFLLWISVMFGGQGLLMSTVEEKSSRVMEVLLSAVSPVELMTGKILGQMGVAAVIMSLYAFTGVGALLVFNRAHLLDTTALVCTPIYFIIAFFLMASMIAAVGSVVNDIREAQVLMQPIMMVMVIPMVLWFPISRNPNGMFAQIVSFLPPISPFVMVVRLAGSEKIPVWQIPATMVLGVASMAFMAWAAAKIFRIGVLMYGKPPNFKTLIRWVRMA